MNNNKRVLTYGTFDIFHIGHLKLLKRLSALGNYLMVAVSTDKFNQEKNKQSFVPYEYRMEIIKSIRYVDDVIPETTWEQKIADIKKHKIDIFAMGDDWTGKFDYLEEFCEVIYLPRTAGVSTSDFKTALLK